MRQFLFYSAVRAMISWHRLTWSRFIAILAGLGAAALVVSQVAGVSYPRVAFWLMAASAGIMAFTERVQGGESKPKTEKRKMTMRNYRNRLLPIVLICCVLLTGCNQAKLAKRTAQTANGFATGIAAGVILKRELAMGGVLNSAGARAVGQALLDTTRATLAITDQAECFTHYTADNKAAILRAADDLIRALSRLNAQGVLHIHSVSGQLRFALWIATASAAVITLRSFLGAMKVNESADIPPDVLELCQRAGESLRQSEAALLADLGTDEMQ